MLESGAPRPGASVCSGHGGWSGFAHKWYGSSVYPPQLGECGPHQAACHAREYQARHEPRTGDEAAAAPPQAELQVRRARRGDPLSCRLHLQPAPHRGVRGRVLLARVSHPLVQVEDQNRLLAGEAPCQSPPRSSCNQGLRGCRLDRVSDLGTRPRPVSFSSFRFSRQKSWLVSEQVKIAITKETHCRR
jgi:hypothetical protein